MKFIGSCMLLLYILNANLVNCINKNIKSNLYFDILKYIPKRIVSNANFNTFKWGLKRLVCDMYKHFKHELKYFA